VADFVYPVEALKDDVVSILTAYGDTTEHSLGTRELAALKAPPRYVWIPTRARDRNDPTTSKTEEVRSLGILRESFEVHCWGSSFRVAWALRQNLLKAIHDSVAASVQADAGRWIDPANAWNQRGEVYVLELSLMSPIQDAIVDLSTLEQPEQATELLTSSETEAYHSPDLNTDGELIVTDIAP
jgi:hypothetical protein